MVYCATMSSSTKVFMRAENLCESHHLIDFDSRCHDTIQNRFSIQRNSRFKTDSQFNEWQRGHYFQSLAPAYCVPNHSLVSLVH